MLCSDGSGGTETCATGGGGGGGSSGGSTPQTTLSAAINLSSATTTQLIAGSGSNLTYITQLNIVAGATGALTLEYGTGSSCTSPTSLTGAYPWTAQAGISMGSGLGAIFVPIPAGDSVCAVTTGSVSMQGSIGYTQTTGTITSFGGGGGAATYIQTNVYTPISATNSSSTTTISAGSPTTLVAVNVGLVNGAYCAPGASATTSDHYLAPGGGWFSWNPGGATTLACITSGGTVTTTINVTGGSGIPTGSGGGGGGSGGGTADSTITATGTLSAADSAATSTTWTNNQTVLTWSSTPTTGSNLEFPGFAGVQSGVLICSGTFSGTAEFDAMMDNASPSHYVKQGVTELIGGATPDKTGSFTGPVIGKINLTGAIGGRIRATAYSSGSLTCTIRITTNIADVHVSNVLPPGVTKNSHLTTNTTGTSLLNGVAGQSIYVSSYLAMAGGTTNVSLGWSTSTSCTSITTLVGPLPLQAQAGAAPGDGTASVLTIPVGDTLCIISDGSGVAVGGSFQATQY